MLRRVPWAMLILVVFTGVNLYWLVPLFSGNEPYGNELSLHLAESRGLASALRNLDPNLWNPSANLGFPSGYYYPLLPQLLIALLHVGLVPLAAALKLAIAFALCALPIAVYRAVLFTKAGRTEAVLAALIVGCVCADSAWGIGADSMFSTGSYPQAWALVFYPLALVYGRACLLEGTNLPGAVLFTLLTGLCDPFLALCLVVALPMARIHTVPFPTVAGRGFSLFLLVGLCSAFFWAPFILHFDAFGGLPSMIAGEEGVEPAVLLDQHLRGFWLDGGSAIPVVTGLFVVAVLLMAHGETRRGPLGWWVRQGLAFSGLIVAGPYLVAGEENLLRAARFVVPMQLAIGCAGGLALGRLGVLLAVWGRSRPQAVLRSASTILAISLAAAPVVGALFNKDAQMKEVVRTLGDDSKFHRPELLTVIEFLDNRPPGRVLAAPHLGTGSPWWMVEPYVGSGQPVVHGEGGAAYRSTPSVRFLSSVRAESYARLFDVRYALVEKAKRATVESLGRSVFETEHFEVFELDADGLFFFSDLAGAIVKSDEVLPWLAALKPTDPLKLVGTPRKPVAGRAKGKVLSEERAPSVLRAHVEVEEPRSLLVLSVSYHPAWVVEIDGLAVETLQVAPGLLGVAVPDGAHTVTFRFERPMFSWALLLATFILFALLYVRGRRASS